jgi:sulfur-oxidizing protein SoxY
LEVSTMKEYRMDNYSSLVGPLCRRSLLKIAASAGAVAFAMGATHTPAMADAGGDLSKWPKEAFDAKDEPAAIKALFGKSATPSDKVKLEAPEIAENGAVVPITVSSDLSKTGRISVLVLENPYTLAASYVIPDSTGASVSSRLKLAKTTKVVAVVEAEGGLYSASKDVKVTVGGCGG